MVQNVDIPDNYVYYMYLLNLPYIVFYCFCSNVGTCIVFSIYFPRLFCFCIYVPYGDMNNVIWGALQKPPLRILFVDKSKMFEISLKNLLTSKEKVKTFQKHWSWTLPTQIRRHIKLSLFFVSSVTNAPPILANKLANLHANIRTFVPNFGSASCFLLPHSTSLISS